MVASFKKVQRVTYTLTQAQETVAIPSKKITSRPPVRNVISQPPTRNKNILEVGFELKTNSETEKNVKTETNQYFKNFTANNSPKLLNKFDKYGTPTITFDNIFHYRYFYNLYFLYIYTLTLSVPVLDEERKLT